MRFVFSTAVAFIASMIATAAQADTTTTGYGSASIQSTRNCPASTTTICNGSGAGQQTVRTLNTGGAGLVNSVTYDDGTRGNASAQVVFGDLGLPEMKLSSYSGSANRVSTTLFAYQTFTYTGESEFDLLLSANFHIVNSSSNATNGALPGGAIAFAGFAIWNKADFDAYSIYNYGATLDTAASFTGQGQLFGAASCANYEGEPYAPRATFGMASSLAGGANQNIAIGQQNCYEQTLTLFKGDEFVIASMAQLVTNRGGWADATGTFRIDLDPSVSAEQRELFARSVTFDAPAEVTPVPEPATWAMMVGGFGVIGGAMRRRRVKGALAA